MKMVWAMVLACVAALFGAATARADDVSFLAAVRDAGFGGYDEDVLRNGHTACALSNQFGDYLTVRAISRAAGVSRDRGDVFLSLAKVHLC